MGRTIYTVKKSIEVHGAYKCSKCKKINYFENIIDETTKDSIYGTWHSKETNEKMFESVSEQADMAISSRTMQIIQEAKDRKYFSADLKGRCQYCGNREPWQRLHYSFYRFFDKIIFISIWLGITLCLVSLCARNPLLFLIFLISECLIGFTYFTLKRTAIKKREKEIALMDEESLPNFFWNEEMLYSYMQKNDPEALKAFLDKTLEEDEYDFCDVCGARLKENQEICHVCGKQTKN